jgi:hypothetical protein
MATPGGPCNGFFRPMRESLSHKGSYAIDLYHDCLTRTSAKGVILLMMYEGVIKLLEQASRMDGTAAIPNLDSPTLGGKPMVCTVPLLQV